jgi:hypothetical protein
MRNGANALVALLALAILLCLGVELFTITAPILKNYNEGWNAYHAASAIQAPAALYPAPASLLTNNYPPLSYFLVGWAAKLTGGDAIIAGRIVAFLSTLGIGLCLGLSARAMGCSLRQAAVAALLFWGAPWVIVKFSAMDDPQMLGNFLDAIGLAIILRAPRSFVHVAIAALFLTLAEFVKPLYVTLPLALLAWLFVYARKSALWLPCISNCWAICFRRGFFSGPKSPASPANGCWWSSCPLLPRWPCSGAKGMALLFWSRFMPRLLSHRPSCFPVVTASAPAR